MTKSDKQKDLSKLTVSELFDYLVECLKQSKRKKPVKELLKTIKRRWESN